MQTSLDVRLPEPHAAQLQVIQESKRFNVLACGRRWGKTTLGMDRLIQPAISGKPVSWYSPSYKNMGESWREVLRTLGGLVNAKNQTERRIELVTGGTIEFWSLDSPDVADAVRGRKYAIAIIDEAATISDLVEVYSRVIRPTLADLKGGAWFLSTPRGFNGFQALYSRGNDPQMTEWASWRMPTASNPHIEAEEIAAMRAEMTEAAYEQEIEANFITWEGAVFRYLNEATMSPEAVEMAAESYPVGRSRDFGFVHRHFITGEQESRFVIGVDWGRTVDYTVFSVLDVTRSRMVALERSNQVDYTLQRERLRTLRNRWQPIEIIAEANSIGQPIIEQLLRDDQGYTVHHLQREQGANHRGSSACLRTSGTPDLPRSGADGGTSGLSVRGTSERLNPLWRTSGDAR